MEMYVKETADNLSAVLILEIKDYSLFCFLMIEQEEQLPSPV